MGERENEEKEWDGGEQRKRDGGSKGGAEKEFFTASTTWGAQLPRGSVQSLSCVRLFATP